jgi:hypothetical protein
MPSRGKPTGSTTTYGYPKAAAPQDAGTVVSSETFPDGELVSYSYDESGAQQSIAAGGSRIVNRVVHNARCQTLSVDYGDGTASTHCYNGASCGASNTPNTDLRLRHLVTVDANGNALQAYGYGYLAVPRGPRPGRVRSPSATYARTNRCRRTAIAPPWGENGVHAAYAHLDAFAQGRDSTLARDLHP